MTKQEILDYFSLIDFAYNESGRLESLSRMIDELLKEQDTCENCAMAIEDRQFVVRCKDCKHYCQGYACQYIDVYPYPEPDWFCASGERREDDERKTSAEGGE